MKDTKKTCPLFFADSEHNCTDCLGPECAFWVKDHLEENGGNCAIYFLGLKADSELDADGI